MKNLLLLIAQAFALFSFSKNNIPETPFAEYQFEAKECKIIQHNKSRIFVPSYTFYLDGKIYDGKVNLKYREFIDQLDIILNHIPMNYAENNKNHVLESAGMFELYAYGNGKQLSFAPNKKIKVQLATKFDMAGGETYVLDKQDNLWKKKTSFGTLPESNQVLTDNKEDLWNNIWQDNDGGDNFIMDDTGGVLRVVVIDKQTQVSYEEIKNQSFKTMNVDNMEMYNCDRILSEQTVPLIADFNLKGYKEKLNSEIYVVYKNRNAVITYYPTQFETDFKLLPNEDFTIFTFSKDGKIAVLDNTFTSTFDTKSNANKKVVFPMNVFEKTPSTKEELAALTGL